MFLHRHLFSKHGDEFGICATGCIIAPEQSSEMERREVLLESVEELERSTPATVSITGNQIEGYRLTYETTLPCGHVEHARAELYLSERDCSPESLTEEALGANRDQYMVVPL